ncbi:MAG: hypothetical protein ABL983_02600 [Nitrospira sp.]
MLAMIPLPLWLLTGSLLLAGLLGAGLVWHRRVAPLAQTLTRLRNEHRQLHGALLLLRAEVGHAVRAHYDEGLNQAIRHADHVVMALPLFRDLPTVHATTTNRPTESSQPTPHTVPS